MGAAHSANIALGRRVADLVADCSIELSPRDAFAGPALRALFAPGTTVFVNQPSTATHHEVVAACRRLQRAGFVAVPHVVARHLASYTQARDFLQRAVGEAGVDQILLLGGDPARPAGPFGSALDVLSTGLVEHHGIDRVGFAGYPAPHPQIATHLLEAALQAKLALAVQRGLQAFLITQFGFMAAPILQWLKVQRAAGLRCPIRIGVAGPASVATLAKFAVRCGIGTSLRAFAHGHTAFARILTEATPDTLIEALATGEDPSSPIDGIHVFTFGGVRRTANWAASLSAPQGRKGVG